MKFSTKLDRIMSTKKINKTELAELIGVSRSTLKNWYNGKEPRNDYKNRINEVYKEVTKLATKTTRVGHLPSVSRTTTEFQKSKNMGGHFNTHEYELELGDYISINYELLLESIRIDSGDFTTLEKYITPIGEINGVEVFDLRVIHIWLNNLDGFTSWLREYKFFYDLKEGKDIFTLKRLKYKEVYGTLQTVRTIFKPNPNNKPNTQLVVKYLEENYNDIIPMERKADIVRRNDEITPLEELERNAEEFIVKVGEINGIELINLEDLHTWLGIRDRLTKWWNKLLDENNYIENEDYVRADINTKEYQIHITGDIAGDIAMQSTNSRKAKAVRNVFRRRSRELTKIHKTNAVIETMNYEQLMVLAEVKKEVEEKEKQLALQQPKVDYYDEVLNTTNTFPLKIIAKDLGMTPNKLNKILAEEKIIYKQGKNWYLYSQYENEGYHRYSTYKNEYGTFHNLQWTEKGREFITRLILNKQLTLDF